MLVKQNYVGKSLCKLLTVQFEQIITDTANKNLN